MHFLKINVILSTSPQNTKLLITNKFTLKSNKRNSSLIIFIFVTMSPFSDDVNIIYHI